MVFVAWWTGRGYTTILIVIATLILLSVSARVLNLPEGRWLFGLELLAAAAANWLIGRKINRRSLAKVRSHRLRERLIYRARHKFMSLPMETFSFIIALVGAGMLVWEIVQSA